MKNNANTVSLLDIPELEELITATPVIERRAGEALFQFGERCTDLPLVISGTASIYARDRASRRITLYRLERGDICPLSLSGLLLQSNYTSWAIVDTTLHVRYLCGKKVQAAISHTPELFNVFLDSLATTLQNAVWTAHQLVLCSPDNEPFGTSVQRSIRHDSRLTNHHTWWH